MPSAEAATPEPVYASPTASSIAWMVPSSPNGPCSPMTTTGRRVARSQPIERGTDGDRPLRAQPARVVVGGGIAVSAPVVGRQPPPRPVEVDQHLADVGTGLGERERDRRARHDRHVVLGRRAAEQHDDRRELGGGHSGHGQPSQSPMNSISYSRATPLVSATTART